MKVKVWKRVTTIFCDLCKKDITRGNHYSTKFDDGEEMEYCSDECGDALKVLKAKNKDV